MERITMAVNVPQSGESASKKQHRRYRAADVDAAVDKLGRLEDLCVSLLKEQEETVARMDRLKCEDKTKTVQFRQLMAKKLTNQNMLDLLHIYDLI